MVKNTNKKFISIIISCILMIVCSIGIVYAWVIVTKRTNSINIVSSGVKYTYSINNEKKLKNTTYIINDLVFFDIDSLYEIDDFLSMASMIEIEVRNTGDLDIDFQVYQSLGAPTLNNSSGVLCIFSETIINDVSEYNTISELINDPNQITGRLNKYVDSADTKTLYVYIIGVQTDDTSNNEFLDDNYSFQITIKALSVGGDE